jgi:hypothetical protein
MGQEAHLTREMKTLKGRASRLKEGLDPKRGQAR